MEKPTSYFISDCHFGERAIIDFYHRPFSSVKEMNRAMVENWNKTVTDKDTVYYLGDISDMHMLRKLNGKIVFVMGNHDREKWSADDIRSEADNVIAVSEYPIMVGGLWLSHEPIEYMPAECPYLNIHGHTHLMDYGQITKRTWNEGLRYFNVSVEKIGYKPISREEIVKRIGYGKKHSK